MQTSDENEEKHQLGDYQLIQYQFLGPIIVRINDIVKHLSSFVEENTENCVHEYLSIEITSCRVEILLNQST